MTAISLLILKKDTYYLEENNSIRQAMEKFDVHKFTNIPIIKHNGEFITTVSEGDILRYIKNKHNFDVKAAEKISIMVIEKYRQYKAAKIDSPIEEIFNLSKSQNFIPIVDDRNMYIGIVTRSSIIDYYLRKKQSK